MKWAPDRNFVARCEFPPYTDEGMRCWQRRLTHPLQKKRGRPPRYPEPLILALLIAQQQRNTSLRALLAWARNQELVEAPTLATLPYRFAHIEESRLQAFNQWGTQQIVGN